MKKLSKKVSASSVTALLLIVVLLLCACGSAESTKSEAKVSGATRKGEVTNIMMALPSLNASYLPLFVAEKNKLFEKNNVNVTFTRVQGGVIALRGLQTNEYQIISSLPESAITGVAQGANIKIIGTLDDQSMYTIYTTSDIKSPNDLKGKVVATNRTGNGTDIQLRWWLKKMVLNLIRMSALLKREKILLVFRL